ncbi:MAG: hypothetical protein HDR00_07220 [Lachnospiraceae bacterium]|nr:hypothetical protein [Lachnospiraceae bacterium]
MFYVGMIEDDQAEASAVMLSLGVNAKQLSEESFKLYELEKKENFREELFEKLIKDVRENKIQCLIVDYKLDTMDEVLEGIEVVNFMHEWIPEFPVIILTDVPERSKKNDNADPDKVYAKEIFMKPDADETKEMVYHIIRNLERYTKKRSELEIEREQRLNKLVDESGYDDKLYGELLDIEHELSKYVPIEMTGIDEAYNMVDMEDALKVLKEYKSLLE